MKPRVGVTTRHAAKKEPKFVPKAAPKRKRPVVPPQALHASERSGYAAQVMPERASPGMKGTVLPIGSPTGRQEGRIAPADRTYNARYEVVTAEEAQSRMSKRIKGEMPLIRGGLDESGLDDAGIIESRNDGMDPFEPQDLRPQQRKVARSLADESGEPPQRAYPPAPVVDPQIRAMIQYLAQRKRVVLELPDTTVHVSAVDVIVSRYGVTLLLPTSGDTSTFVPKPATELMIEFDNQVLACYYPGASFEIEALKLLGLSFIRKEED